MTNTIRVNGKTYLMTGDANYEYRSQINGMQCICPDNWVSLPLMDTENGTPCIAWYKVDDGAELDSIDYDEPDDIIDDWGRIVYSK